ncbi:uncharacterized mitochondrial protein AtMg00310-like [Lotus japonicus]|uniref:uncharacterized mitochondrial protein AtMg00310-like n=1 Tax=Lotus japonicus TaxID=34305 RepID=UPI0025881194|nr:uncharacterized mitochondrial protein AtMg00310-like [Lotus japonicus]
MSCFILPDGLCANIDSMISRFYWGSDVTKRGLNWCKWSKLCRHKSVGGLGFRNLKNFDMALVAKNWWKVYTCPNSLLRRVFKAVYFHASDLYGAKKGYRPSYAWTSIWKTRWVFQRGGGLWRIGNGERVDVWVVRWIPRGAPVIYREDLAAELNIRRVAGLMSNGQWNSPLIEAMFCLGTTKAILAIPLSLGLGQDILFWP